jgi:AcrR family transcriptional regulator
MVLVSSPAPARADTPAARVLDATVTCLARWGLSKTTLDDVARAAGVSRATVYRLFPGGRDVLVRAALAAEVDELERDLAERLAGVEELGERLAVVVGTLVGAVRDHAALQYVLEHEPEHVLPHLTFGHLDAVLAAAGERLAPWLDGDPRSGEWVARVVVSYAFTPSPHVDLGDEADVRRFVGTYLLPALERRTTHG